MIANFCKSKFICPILLLANSFILTGCIPSEIVFGDIPQTVEEYVPLMSNRVKPDIRLINLHFNETVKRLHAVSKRCYQYSTELSLNGGVTARDKVTTKVTMLSPKRAAFTMQEKRYYGDDKYFMNKNTKEPEDGMWVYSIVIDDNGPTSKASLYYSPFFMEKPVHSVIDTLEGKYGQGCPPEDVLLPRA